jgi:hypothetical protein
VWCAWCVWCCGVLRPWDVCSGLLLFPGAAQSSNQHCSITSNQQAESFGNEITDNIAYNGPRAGINFDDGMGGGSKVLRNVLFNMCRESSDHGS